MIGVLTMFLNLPLFQQNPTFFSCKRSFLSGIIRSGSFPDQVFGGIEKKMRKRESIASPREYYDIFSQHGKVQKMGSDWQVIDFKAGTKGIIKSQLGVKLTEQKVITYCKEKPNEVGFTASYSNEPQFYNILKRGKQFSHLSNASIAPMENKVKVVRKNDVEKLLKFFAMPDDDETKQFYADVLASTATGKDAQDKIVYNDEGECVV